MDVAKVLCEEWIAAWNARNLEAILSHYEPNVVFESPRLVAAFASSGGKVGSPDGVLCGVDSLRPYFKHAIDNLPSLHLELLQVLEGPPGGWFAVHYRRETGACAVETFQLSDTQQQQQQQQQGQRQQQQEQQQHGATRSSSQQGQQPGRIAAVRVFYEAVC